MAKTNEYLKSLKLVNFGGFRFRSTDELEKGIEIRDYLKRFDQALTTLNIEDPEEKKKLFELLDNTIADDAESGILATDDRVKGEKDPWKNLKLKIKYFYQIDRLKQKARTKLNKIKQGDRSANQLLVDILKLYEAAEYGTDSGEYVIETLLNALKDKEVKVHYAYSELPDRKKLTVSQIVEYANVIADAKQEEKQAAAAANVHKVEEETVKKVYGRGKKFGKKNQGYQSKNPGYQGSQGYKGKRKCNGCGSFDHETGDKRCFALGKKCFKCGKADHLKQMCYSKKPQGRGHYNKRVSEDTDQDLDHEEQCEAAIQLARNIYL